MTGQSSLPWAPRKAGDGITVTVRVKPGASRPRIGAIIVLPSGPALELAVAARPIEGRANTAVIAALAEAWGIPRSSINIASGNTSRLKSVFVQGEPDRLLRHLTAWFDQRAVTGRP